jgi:hypothetical protein
MSDDDVQPPLFGSWPADDLRRAFVAGAQWWEYIATGGFTMWPSDRDKAEEEAEERYPNGRPKSR